MTKQLVYLNVKNKRNIELVTFKCTKKVQLIIFKRIKEMKSIKETKIVINCSVSNKDNY